MALTRVWVAEAATIDSASSALADPLVRNMARPSDAEKSNRINGTCVAPGDL